MALLGAELLQDELGGEVVAPAVHVAEDLPERRGRDMCERNGRLRRDALLGFAGDLHAGALQGLLEERSGGESRPVRELAVERAAVDRQGREGRGLPSAEVRP